MRFNPDGFGDLFDENEDGVSANNLEDVFKYLSHQMEEHDMPPQMALEGLLNLLKPGATSCSHDVIQHFRVGMAIQGYLDEAKNVNCLWFTTFPWGLGFHFGFEPGYLAEGMPPKVKHAVVVTLAGILQAGGVNASVTENDTLNIKRDDGESQDIDVLVTKFRNEMDAELGPDAPTNDLPSTGPELRDWLRRWMPDQE